MTDRDCGPNSVLCRSKEYEQPNRQLRLVFLLKTFSFRRHVLLAEDGSNQ